MSYSPFILENNNSTTGLEISLKAINLLVQQKVKKNKNKNKSK